MKLVVLIPSSLWSIMTVTWIFTYEELTQSLHDLKTQRDRSIDNVPSELKNGVQGSKIGRIDTLWIDVYELQSFKDVLSSRHRKNDIRVQNVAPDEGAFIVPEQLGDIVYSIDHVELVSENNYHWRSDFPHRSNILELYFMQGLQISHCLMLCSMWSRRFYYLSISSWRSEFRLETKLWRPMQSRSVQGDLPLVWPRETVGHALPSKCRQASLHIWPRNSPSSQLNCKLQRITTEKQFFNTCKVRYLAIEGHAGAKPDTGLGSCAEAPASARRLGRAGTPLPRCGMRLSEGYAVAGPFWSNSLKLQFHNIFLSWNCIPLRNPFSIHKGRATNIQEVVKCKIHNVQAPHQFSMSEVPTKLIMKEDTNIEKNSECHWI